MDDFRNCAVCYEQFDRIRVIPKLLVPCKHTHITLALTWYT